MLLEHIEWLARWRSIGPGPERAILEKELEREVRRRHVLGGRRAVAVARRDDNDDVLFHLPDRPALLAVVHLSGHRQRKPEFLWTVLYHSLTEFVERCMLPDHQAE